MRPFQRLLSGIFLVTALYLIGLPASSVSAQTVELSGGPADLGIIVQKFGEPLGAVTADPQAIGIFVNQIGPALGLQDVATTLAAKHMPPKVAKELNVPEVTASVQRLMASLVAWHTADRLMQALSTHAETVPTPPAGLVEWVHATAPFPALVDTTATQTDAAARAVSAGRVALEAQQRAATEWWQLKTWRERVRTIRGRNRLCGTWQWTIHNHQQHHQDQKLVIIFPPPGSDRPAMQGLVETVVLGENVYLRWEQDGHMQEDSLQFLKEGKVLEGTFVNSQGGWGSISGKRTSDCKL